MPVAEETKYELQVRLVQGALQALGEEPKTAAEIRGWIEHHYPDLASSLNTVWGTYMTRAVQDPENPIERTPGQYTYTLRLEAVASPSSPPPAENEATDSTDEAPAKQQREEKLYAPLAKWLRAQGFGARLTSNGKKGGVWGNPDVTGIKVVEGFFGRKDLEVCTVEAKISRAYWRYYFFEAVAHKRFAHRAYFAFGYGTDEPSLNGFPEAKELREYGEKYGVGILVVFIPLSKYEPLANGDASKTELDLEDLRIEELWPATFEKVTPSARANFLSDVLGLREDRDIYQFDDAN